MWVHLVPDSPQRKSNSSDFFFLARLPRDYNEADDPRALRRKKKSFYAKLKKQEMEREAELAKKYRNRVSN